MADGYWVISVDRETWAATTSELFDDADQAWQHSIDIQDAATYTTVVSRRTSHPSNKQRWPADAPIDAGRSNTIWPRTR